MQQAEITERCPAVLTGAAYYTLEGYRRRFPWTTCADVSAKYRTMLTLLGLGASRAPSLTAYDSADKPVGYVSYNGRVWAGAPGSWRHSAEMVYCPSWERQP